MTSERFKIRVGAVDDAYGITKVRIETWRAFYRGIVPDAYLAAMNIEQESERRTEWLKNPAPDTSFAVAESLHGEIVGFSMSGPVRKKIEKFTGEIYALYVLKDFQRHGLGGELFREAVRSLKSLGHLNFVVWTLKENSSVQFYEKMGGKFVGADKIEIGEALDAVAYGWDNIL